MSAIKTVPFNQAWVTSDKLDIRAIYRRPRLDALKQRVVVDGVPQWDYTSALPIRRHNDWAAKGYEYVTLATMQDLADAAKGLAAQGIDPHQFDASYEGFGEMERRAFRIKGYLEQRDAVDDGVRDELRTMVEAYGSDAVENIKRIENPAFELPAHLRGIAAPGGEKASPRTAAPKGEPKPRRSRKTAGAPA